MCRRGGRGFTEILLRRVKKKNRRRIPRGTAIFQAFCSAKKELEVSETGGVFGKGSKAKEERTTSITIRCRRLRKSEVL